MPGDFQQRRRAFRDVAIVVDDQHGKAACGRRAGQSHLTVIRLRCGRRPRHRQPNDKLAPLTRSFAVSNDGPAQHLDEAADDRKSDAQTPFGAIDCPIQLREQLEDAEQRFLRYSHSRVANAQHDVIVLLLDRNRDPAARLRVLRRIGKQIADDLRDPREIVAQMQRRGRQLDLQRVTHRIDLRARRFDRHLDHARNINRLNAKLDLAAIDPRDVDQIVDESNEQIELPANQAARPCRPRRGGFIGVEDMESVADRRKRIAQLVREHGEEFVLAPVLFADTSKERRVVERNRRARR